MSIHQSTFRRHIIGLPGSLAVASLVLATSALTGVAQAAEFPAIIDLSTLNGLTGTRFDGVAAGDNSGTAVARAGDVNGDGFDDFIIGARFAATANPKTGSAYVVFGVASGLPASLNLSLLDGSNGFEIRGAAFENYLGNAAASGDVNGDGFSDVVIGAYRYGSSKSGAAYVVFGHAGVFPAEIESSALNGTDGFRFTGTTSFEFAGSSVAAADINDDGFDDVVIGGKLADNSASNSGSVYVVFGKAQPFAASIDQSALNGTTGTRLDGAVADDDAGTSVAAAGDVNGDGIGDLLVGAPLTDPHGAYSGSSYVVYGKTTAFAASQNLGLLNGTNGFRMDGGMAFAQAGFAVDGAGDVNGDGFADIVVGALGGSDGVASGGFGYLVLGRGSRPASIELETTKLGDGVTRFHTLVGGGRLGTAVSGVGDVNGDGFADFMIGTPGDNGDQGAAFVVLGKAASFGLQVDMATFDGSNGFKLTGENAQDIAGQTVGGAGDFNNDGFGDFAIGAQQADAPGANSGSSYLLYGRAPNSARTRVGSAAGQYISGGRFADTLRGLAGEDRLEGRGGGDVLVGGTEKDTASYLHATFRVIADLAVPANNTGVAAGDSYVSIENLEGSSFNDILRGNSLANRLTGNTGNDVLSGAAGPDVLVGGRGADTLTGGSESDVFVYGALADSLPVSTGRDRIADFNAGGAGSKVDVIDLSAIDARTGVDGDQAFIFIGTAAFSHTKGHVWTAPGCQGTFLRRRAGRSSHVFGL